MSRVAWGLMLLMGCAGDAQDDGVATRKRCEKLRDHLVELRLADASGIDHAAHREAMQRALGDDFIGSCTSSLTPTQVTCALDAKDTASATSCSSSRE